MFVQALKNITELPFSNDLGMLSVGVLKMEHL